MAKRSAEVDAYIEKAAPFAKPILQKIRKAYHAANSEVEETMKWSVPHFEYKGVLGNMAAFKLHVGFGFWKAKLMKDPEGLLQTGSWMAKVTDVSELPSQKTLVAYIREAIRLNEEGVKLPRTAPRKRGTPAEVPKELRAALKKNKKAKETFENFPPSHQREYAEWISEAKQDATRKKRLATAIERLSEGKPRNWKYAKGRG